MVKREVLATSKEFKEFWKDKGPFRYALTSSEFPPVLLEPEEWIFSNDLTALLKSLMQFEVRKMKLVQAPFNPDNKKILRPETLSPWKINHFPEEWNGYECSCFIPEGHLTRAVMDMAEKGAAAGAEEMEDVFFNCLAGEIETMGYAFLKPAGSSKYAAVHSYLEEWEQDELDAGIL